LLLLMLVPLVVHCARAAPGSNANANSPTNAAA
jgi:hypothetical protein